MPFFLLVGAILTALKIAGFVGLSWLFIGLITFIPLLIFFAIMAIVGAGIGAAVLFRQRR